MKDFCFDERFLNEWIRRLPDAEVARFEEAGHYLFEDAGAALRERMASFARTVHPRPASRTER